MLGVRPAGADHQPQGRYDPKNPTEGNYNVFLDFENGTTASLIYNGYGYFDSSELTAAFGELGDGNGRGLPRDPAVQP